MRPRPIRSQLYLPIFRFGITDEDWGFSRTRTGAL